MHLHRVLISTSFLSLIAIPPLFADVESQIPESPEKGYSDVTERAIDAHVVRRGFRTRTLAAQEVRRRRQSLPPGLLAAMPITAESAVHGSVEVPVIALVFSNTPAIPYPVADLEERLFNPGNAGSMTAHYDEMSHGVLEVSGEVLEWIELPEGDLFYAGDCNGTCGAAKMPAFLTSAFTEADVEIDFTQFDNDGPDNIPNSGDDDGFVDFVALVHPESGGECGDGGNGNIWSHRFAFSGWTGTAFETGDVGQANVPIFIDDYVIMPAFDCDDATMIQIGVFSHEFGHAFGLPDLYDSTRPAQSSGIGGWGLMASGSWGCDGVSSSHQPCHMTAWSKEFLGWVTPQVIDTDTTAVRIRPYVESGDVVRVDYTDAEDPEDNHYLLLSFRNQFGFDSLLTGPGLLVTEIDNARVQAGLVNNSVNGDPTQLGVNVIEADGAQHLDFMTNRADGGDVFPGTAGVLNLDAAHTEAPRAALCNITVSADFIELDIFTSQSTCPGMLAGAVQHAAQTTEGKLHGEEVILIGVIENMGTNLFSDRDLVFKDPDNPEYSIPVTVPVPTESVLGTIEGPTNLADVLGQRVVVRGTLTEGVLKGYGETDVLKLEELEILNE